MKKEAEDKNIEVTKTLLAVTFGIFLIGFSWYYVEHWQERGDVNQEDQQSSEEQETISLDEEEGASNEELKSIVSCLADKGVVVYGLDTCPACSSLIANFGGKDIIEEVYVECNKDRDRCDKEKLTTFVPEIHIDGELYEGSRTPSAIAVEAGCTS